MAKWPYNTALWQKLRRRKLAAAPVCHPCWLRGEVTLAKAVDHIVPISDGGNPFPPLDGLMSMCERCHNEKTAANDRAGAKPFARKVKGFDANGDPVDPSDDWHQAGGGSDHENGPETGPAAALEKYLVSGTSNTDDPDESGFA
ncbi:MAG: HNH endonuclease [Roseibium sp.]|uniref:HNH endonuclease signature motif containing protein n=1 Tax=Roseibium sp. TaxID=1936156 RepID=UPI002635C174|nr:HNH endonuclease signature motif containing protein [Roseibium sp.]MCV0428380.1 HNH endonuclease [Roseibium sp.]